MLAKYNAVKNGLVTSPLLVDSTVDDVHNAILLADTGCNVFGVVTASYVRRHNLHRVRIQPRQVYTYDDRPAEQVQVVVKATVNVGGIPTPSFMYEVKRVEDQDMILELRWMMRNQVVIDAAEKTLIFRKHNIRVRSVLPNCHVGMISAAGFKFWKNKSLRQEQKDKIEIFSASMADIEKARPQEAVAPSVAPVLGIVQPAKTQTSCLRIAAKELTTVLSYRRRPMVGIWKYLSGLSIPCLAMNYWSFGKPSTSSSIKGSFV